MRLTEEEKQAVLALRKLDDQQRANVIAYMSRQSIANRITERVAGIQTLHTIADRKVEKAFGAPSRGGSRK